MLLSLDISTSITGFCVFNKNQCVHIGHIDLRKEKDFFKKVDLVKAQIHELNEQYKFKEVAIEENSQDYITDFDGTLFSVQYTLDVAIWDDVFVNAVVTDKFGQKTEVTIANHSSLKSRVTTSLVNLAAGISEFFGGALATGIAGFTGFVYGVFTVLKDTVDMVISVGKFLVKLAKDFFNVIKSFLPRFYFWIRLFYQCIECRYFFRHRLKLLLNDIW